MTNLEKKYCETCENFETCKKKHHKCQKLIEWLDGYATAQQTIITYLDSRLDKLWEEIPDSEVVLKGNATNAELKSLAKYAALESVKDYVETLEQRK